MIPVARSTRPGRMALRLALGALVGLAMARIAAPASAADSPPAPAATDTSLVSDPHAIAIADQVTEWLGGRQRWDALRGLRWTFEVSTNDTVRSVRRHSWDKTAGWHRVSGKTRAGVDFLFIHKLNTNEGMAWMGGNKIEGDSLRKLLKRANSLWINDTYWMLMPYKLRDPGVTLKYAGSERMGDYIFDKIALSFRDVGDTPGDHYWVWVNRGSHRVERWDMVLQGNKPPPESYSWEGWEQHDGLWFATTKRGADKHVIYTRNLETVDSFPAAEFTQP